ncbi:MAG TPA: glycosyltransferase, partial [Oligoflexia bacterium]|nr:glycosyltransferase [Oligoflexia bacterium]
MPSRNLEMKWAAGKCVLIAPSPERMRGGVAQFSGRLFFELAQRSRTRFISWSRLYPDFIISRRLADGQLAAGVSETSFILSCLNPATWRRCVQEIVREQPDLVLLTWVHPFHAPVYWYLLKQLKTLTRAQLMLVCHNILPHEGFPGAGLLTHLTFRLADSLIVHSTHAAHEARIITKSRIPILTLFLPLEHRPCALEAHPSKALQEVKPGSSEAESKRCDYSPVPVWDKCEELRMLFFGTIRKYKGLDILLSALNLVARRFPHFRLTVAGELFYANSLRCLPVSHGIKRLTQNIVRLGLAEHVKLDLRYIPDSEVPRLFREAHLVMLPYRSVWQSAVLPLAYSFGKPVIAAATGGLLDAVIDGQSGYFAEAGNPASFAEAILRFIEKPLTA